MTADLRFSFSKMKSQLRNPAIKADENFVEAHAVSGDCYFDIGNLKSAIIEYQKVVDIDPDFIIPKYHKKMTESEQINHRVGESRTYSYSHH